MVLEGSTKEEEEEEGHHFRRKHTRRRTKHDLRTITWAKSEVQKTETQTKFEREAPKRERERTNTWLEREAVNTRKREKLKEMWYTTKCGRQRSSFGHSFGVLTWDQAQLLQHLHLDEMSAPFMSAKYSEVVL